MVAQPVHTRHVLRPLTFDPAMPEAGKQPALPFAWPPRGFREAKNVSSGNWTWGKVAGFYGINVWDLISFNFETTRPRDVNWFLRHYIGCYQSDDDTNFKFEGAAPGVIYIPPVGWTRQIPHFNEFERSFVAMLGGMLATFQDVSYKRMHVTKSAVRQLMHDISAGEFNVFYDPSSKHKAYYSWKEEAIIISFPYARGISDEATFFHEATHAIIHRELKRLHGGGGSKTLVKFVDDEVTAYVCGYLTAYNASPGFMKSKLVGKSPGIHHAALLFAHMIYETGNKAHVELSDYDREFSGAEFPDVLKELAKDQPLWSINPMAYLKEAIRHHPTYADDVDKTYHPSWLK